MFHCRNCKHEDNPNKLIEQVFELNGKKYEDIKTYYCPRCKCSISRSEDITEIFNYKEHVHGR